MKGEELRTRVSQLLGSDSEEADRQTRAVLHVLAEQISRDEGADLASQLPKEYKDVVTSELGSSIHRGNMDRAYFLGRVQAALSLDKMRDAERVTRGVLGALGEAVTPGELEDFAGQLPPELQDALPVRAR